MWKNIVSNEPKISWSLKYLFITVYSSNEVNGLIIFISLVLRKATASYPVKKIVMR